MRCVQELRVRPLRPTLEGECLTLNICLKTVFSETNSKSWNESADTLVTLLVEDDDGWFLFFFPPWKLKMMLTEQGGQGNVQKQKQGRTEMF